MKRKSKLNILQCNKCGKLSIAGRKYEEQQRYGLPYLKCPKCDGSMMKRK